MIPAPEALSFGAGFVRCFMLGLVRFVCFLVMALFAVSVLFKSDSIRLSFVKAVSYFYDLCLYNRLFHVWYVSQWVICLFFLLIFKDWLRFFIVLLIFIIWRFFFVFPYKKRKVVNTVMGPPGSGKTTFCAFINKWAAAIGETVFRKSSENLLALPGALVFAGN